MEPISRISHILDAARELTLEASSLSARKSTPSRQLPPSQIKKLLESRSERDILDGLRRVIALDYRRPPTPTLQYFTPIIKNVASTSLEVKKLVYCYLLAHAEAEPQNALMAINAIVRSLSDTNPQVRALALRVMSGIRVPEVSQIVNLYIKRSMGDMSPFVRRAAALAIPKCNRLDPSMKEQLVEYLDTLLGDRQYYVAAAAVGAFNQVCPDRIDLVHRHYRGLVKKMVDMDEWGQLASLKLMTSYARKCFPRRTRKVKRRKGVHQGAKDTAAADPTKGFYEDVDDLATEGTATEGEEIVVDPDLNLLFSALKPLLYSRNSAVILATARTYLYLAPPPPQSDLIPSSIPPLIALLRGPASERAIALTNLVQICLAYPEPFLPYYTHFLLSHQDEPNTRRLKLEILTLLFRHAPAGLRSLILAELAHFSSSADTSLVRDAVRALGRCAQAASASDANDGATAAKCLRLLLAQLNSPHSTLVAESLEVIRHLIQRDPDSHRGTVTQLAKNLDTLTAPQARASIVWLVGEFAGLDADNSIAADMLRILVKGFAAEEESVKMQIILLGAKVYLHWLNAQPEQAPRGGSGNDTTSQENVSSFGDEGVWEDKARSEVDGLAQNEGNTSKSSQPIPALWTYIMLLVRYDVSYDLRDRARLYKNLLSHPSSTSLASLLLLAPKPVPHVPSPGENKAGYSLGSASLFLGSDAGLGSQGVRGYDPIPTWVKDGQEPDPSLRDEDGVATNTDSLGTLPASTRLDSALAEKSIGKTAVGHLNGVNKEKTLDAWLAEDDAVEDSSSEGETEEESEEESEDDSEEGDTDEETDDGNSEADNEHERLVP